MSAPNEKSSKGFETSDEILTVRCRECMENTFYMVSRHGLQAFESVCPVCGFRSIETTGVLRQVESLLRDACVHLKHALEKKGIDASIEMKVSLEDSGNGVRVFDTSCSSPTDQTEDKGSDSLLDSI